MASNKSLLLLPGDGIGPEVMGEVYRVIDWFDRRRAVGFDVKEGLVGGASYDKYGPPVADEIVDQAMQSDAVLFGAVGGPKWDNLDFSVKPERGLLRLRKDMDLFANLRPAIVFDGLIDTSSLKPELVRGLDIMILRELTGGIYFGEPRGVEEISEGERRGINTEVYTTSEVERVGRVAFELAKKRKGFVHSVEKANVMETGKFWRETVTDLHQKEFSDVELKHMYADNCAMQLVRFPKQFDVIVTDNLFGDILSDCAAMLTGSLGMLPSASLSYLKGNKIVSSLYEPVHGSAPDIAGKNIANPLATIMSFSMMLKYSFNNEKLSKILEQSIINVLNKGYRTQDIYNKGSTKVSTDQMGDLIIKELKTII